MPRRGEPPSEAARARWRHYGVLGQLHMALRCVQGVAGLPTATDEAKGFAVEAEAWIGLCVAAMEERKEG